VWGWIGVGEVRCMADRRFGFVDGVMCIQRMGIYL
jgi:hypothetical protein